MGWTVSVCPTIKMPGRSRRGCGKLARTQSPKPMRRQCARCAPRRCQVPAGNIQGAVHGGDIPGGAFALHPRAQALQHGVEVEWEGAEIHKSLPMSFVTRT